MHFGSKPFPSLISRASKKRNLFLESIWVNIKNLFGDFKFLYSYNNFMNKTLGMTILLFDFCTAISVITGYFDMTYLILHKFFLLLSLTRKIRKNIVHVSSCSRLWHISHQSSVTSHKKSTKINDNVL